MPLMHRFAALRASLAAALWLAGMLAPTFSLAQGPYAGYPPQQPAPAGPPFAPTGSAASLVRLPGGTVDGFLTESPSPPAGPVFDNGTAQEVQLASASATDVASILSRLEALEKENVAPKLAQEKTPDDSWTVGWNRLFQLCTEASGLSDRS